MRGKARPLPLDAVRLKPADFATAVEVNRTYLHRLEPDRLLHTFRAYAGMEPKAPIYGGWDSDTIAGHTLGHYMTALALTWQQDRKSVVEGKRVSVRVDLGGRRNIKKKIKTTKTTKQ